jgi:hypothetical protein
MGTSFSFSVIVNAAAESCNLRQSAAMLKSNSLTGKMGTSFSFSVIVNQ